MIRRGWILAALLILVEAVLIATHPDEARTVARTVYQTLWRYAPKPDGYVPPDRFAPRSSESSGGASPSR